jgi:hypothetical protein
LISDQLKGSGTESRKRICRQILIGHWWRETTLALSKKQFREDPSIRGAYETALQERTAEASERIAVATERIAGPLREFDL